jgi:hypothetical protein
MFHHPVALAFGAFILALAIRDAVAALRRRRRYGAAWQAYNAAAFQPQTGPPNERNARLVTRIATEMVSTKGRRAIAVWHGGTRGLAVHEINSDGSFSAREPYFVKLRPCLWTDTGRQHLVEMVHPASPIPTSNPGGGFVKERGSRVIEWDTTRYSPMTLREFEQMQTQQSGVRRADKGRHPAA